MSQFQSFVTSEGPGPGPLLSLTGDIGGAVGPDGAGNINVLANNDPTLTGFAIVSGNAGTNTLSIVPLASTVTTADATLTFFPAAQLPIVPSTAIVMSANVIGNRDDYSAACGGFCTGVARRAAAGGAIAVGDNVLASEDSGAGTPQFGIVLNGNNIAVAVQGVVGQTWNWTCTFTYQVQIL